MPLIHCASQLETKGPPHLHHALGEMEGTGEKELRVRWSQEKGRKPGFNVSFCSPGKGPYIMVHKLATHACTGVSVLCVKHRGQFTRSAEHVVVW